MTDHDDDASFDPKRSRSRAKNTRETPIPVYMTRKVPNTDNYFRMTDGLGGRVTFIMGKDNCPLIISGNIMMSVAEIAAVEVVS